MRVGDGGELWAGVVGRCAAAHRLGPCATVGWFARPYGCSSMGSGGSWVLACAWWNTSAGRRGKRRFVCLEVVERPAADVFVLVSGFGKRAQWYRNLVASPQCWITVGRTRRPARATMLSDAESAEVLSRYATSHPRAWATLRGVIEEAVGHRVDVLPAVRIDRS